MRVLLVEDDAGVSQFLAEGLRMEGASVIVAETAEQGLAVARTQPPDVVVADVMLPGESGIEFCVRLRAEGVSTPVLLLTALDAVEDKITGLRAGADDYLTKPFDFDELLARLEALVRRTRGNELPPARVLKVGDIELDRELLEVRRAGTLVELTPKELALLRVLIEAPDRVMSRQHILSQVWGFDTDPLTNVVDVYIRRLRSKLALDAETGAIRSVRGYGYRFVTAEGETRS